ncbi:FadR/GntR family transcriptional regulator [Shumkonia mesophila]|uniref:FadR/GntR family transcriptional regulator n=1 Tax=Shumkonia mesophila TaxID=2838854 RepID=UPI002934E8AD|nr:FadR/GntR family transcriptional regulator [Shumkonia mesophila]
MISAMARSPLPIHVGSRTFAEEKKQRSQSLHTRIAEDLGLRIMGGKIKPGEILPREAELCEELGVSRTVLREAIKTLSAKGMITAKSKVGTVVNDRHQWNFFDPDLLVWLLSTENISEFLGKLFELRRAIEPVAASLAAQNATFENFNDLHQAFEEMCAATEDLEWWVHADLRFHQAIYFSTGSEFYWPIGQLLRPAFEASFRISSSAEHHQHCLAEHREIRDAILARDPSRASAAVITLLAVSDYDVARALGQNGSQSGARKAI